MTCIIRGVFGASGDLQRRGEGHGRERGRPCQARACAESALSLIRTAKETAGTRDEGGFALTRPFVRKARVERALP